MEPGLIQLQARRLPCDLIAMELLRDQNPGSACVHAKGSSGVSGGAGGAGLMMRPARACRESWQALPASCATVTPGNINPTAPTAEMKERQKHPAGKARVPDARSHHMLGSSYHQSPTYSFHGHLCPLSQLGGLNDKAVLFLIALFS